MSAKRWHSSLSLLWPGLICGICTWNGYWSPGLTGVFFQELQFFPTVRPQKLHCFEKCRICFQLTKYWQWTMHKYWRSQNIYKYHAVWNVCFLQDWIILFKNKTRWKSSLFQECILHNLICNRQKFSSLTRKQYWRQAVIILLRFFSIYINIFQNEPRIITNDRRSWESMGPTWKQRLRPCTSLCDLSSLYWKQRTC